MSGRTFTKLHRELLVALELARTRLAIAIASEAKSTPPGRLEYYLETADRARRFRKKLRGLNIDSMQGHQEWTLVLESLRRIPTQGEAIELSRMLRDIVGRLE